jgi:hypothetical protein
MHAVPEHASAAKVPLTVSGCMVLAQAVIALEITKAVAASTGAMDRIARDLAGTGPL